MTTALLSASAELKKSLRDLEANTGALGGDVYRDESDDEGTPPLPPQKEAHEASEDERGMDVRLKRCTRCSNRFHIVSFKLCTTVENAAWTRVHEEIASFKSYNGQGAAWNDEFVTFQLRLL